MSARSRTIAVILIDVALLGLCAVHLPSVLQRSSVSFSVSSDETGVFVKSISDARRSGGLAANDRLVAWKDQRVTIPEAIEFLADLEVIGSQVPVTYVRDGAESHARVTLLLTYGAISPSSIVSHLVRLVFALSCPATAVLFLFLTIRAAECSIFEDIGSA